MDPLGVLTGPVEYSTVPKVLKICQMTFSLHFDEKIIIIRCVVLKIYAFKIFEKNALFSVTDTIYRDPSQHGKVLKISENFQKEGRGTTVVRREVEMNRFFFRRG